jgi:hypothetical protein
MTDQQKRISTTHSPSFEDPAPLPKRDPRDPSAPGTLATLRKLRSHAHKQKELLKRFLSLHEKCKEYQLSVNNMDSLASDIARYLSTLGHRED